MKILHIWNDYSPNLFDQIHSICLNKNLTSHLVCGNFIDNGAMPLKNTHIFRKRSTDLQNRRGMYWKAYRFVKKLNFKKRFLNFTKNKIFEIKPDIIHWHFGNTAIDLKEIVLTQNIPQCISFYGVDASASLKNETYVKTLKIFFSKNIHYFLLCEDVKKRFTKIGCDINKISIWNLPPGIENYHYRKRPYNKVTKFLMAARFVEKKGHKTVLEALKKLIEIRQDVHLTLFGYGPSDWLESLIDKHKLAAYVTLINNQQSAEFTNQYNKLLDTHHIFLAPSISAQDGDDEGGPALSVIMAQSSGLPVIATHFPGAEISIIDKETGFFCEEQNSSSLSTLMNEMCDKQNLWDTIGHRASELVGQEFSLNWQGEKLIKIYENIYSKNI